MKEFLTVAAGPRELQRISLSMPEFISTRRLVNSKLLITTSAVALWVAAIYGQIAQSPAPARAARPATVATTQAPAPAPAAPARPPAAPAPDLAATRATMDKYCVTCHNGRAKAGGLELDAFDVNHLRDHRELAEKIVLKLRAGMMPPTGMPRPDFAAMNTFI